ncbi:hypothetical protein D3C80_1849110 [compost metagenome]
MFGISQPDAEVMFVNLRASIVGLLPSKPAVELVQATGSSKPAELRSIRFDGLEHQAKVLSREQLSPERRISGPVILEEYDTTVFIPPGFAIYRDAGGNIIGEAEL